MADELFTGVLEHDDDWGGVEREGGKPASGQAVQQYIKGKLINSRVGYFHNVPGDDNSNILYGFANETTFQQWDLAPDKNADGIKELVLAEVKQPKATPQPYHTISIENCENSNTVISADGTVKIKIRYHSTNMTLDASGNTLIPESQASVGQLYAQIYQSGQWVTLELPQSMKNINSSAINNTPVELDFTNLLANGDSVLRLRITEVDTLSNQTYQTQWIQYNVTKTTLSLSFANWYDHMAQNLSNKTTAQKSMNLYYYFTGAVSKVLNIKITGPGGSNTERIYTQSFDKKTIYSSNDNNPYHIELTDSSNSSYKVTASGVHNIEAYLTAVVNGEVIASSNKIYSQILIINNQNDTNSYVILNNINKNLINWTENKLFDYAVYNNASGVSTEDIKIKLYDVDNPSNVFLETIIEDFTVSGPNTVPNVQSYSNTLEIEHTLALVPVAVSVYLGSNETPSYLDAFYVDNTGDFAPVGNSAFVLNPRLYTNNLKNPAIIRNESDKQSDGTSKIIESTWTGFNFTNDGWIEDENKRRCLRILGGQEISIKYNPYSKCTTGCTIETIFAVKNVGYMDENMPVLTIRKLYSNGIYDGWAMLPLKGIFKTQSKDAELEQDVWLQEDKIINLTITMTCNTNPNDDGSMPRNLVKIYINGAINRVFEFAEGDVQNGAFWSSTRAGSNDITIDLGNKDTHTDLDIYGIKVYKRTLSEKDVLKNYISSIPDVSTKTNVLNANDILNDTGTAISYDKCVNLKYNTLLWRPISDKRCADYGKDAPIVGAAYGSTSDTTFPGDLEIRIYNTTNGVRNLDLRRSGTLKNLRVKGQGTSSMTYWKWNQRWEFGKLYFRNDLDAMFDELLSDMDDPNIPNPLKGFEEYISTDESGNRSITEEGKLEYLKSNGEEDEEDKLGWFINSKFYPLQLEGDYAANLSDDEKTKIENEFGGNSYQIRAGVPFAKRLDAKINWASPMQSHKLASVNLYNDVWKRVIKNSELTSVGDTSSGKSFTNTSNGYKDCRVAIIQEPFFLFNKPVNDNSEPEFMGLFTMGPSKGDKPTFGYNKKDFVDFIMMEGCDNGALLANCSIPWNTIDVALDVEDGEAYCYFDRVIKKNEETGEETEILTETKSWEISMGDTDSGDRKDIKNPNSNPVLHMFKNLINFCYLHDISRLEYFIGTYNDFIKNDTVKSTSKTYWMAQDTAGSSEHKKYNVYRYDVRSKQWVHAGVDYQDDVLEFDEGGLLKLKNKEDQYIKYKPYNLYEVYKDKVNLSGVLGADSQHQLFKQAIINDYRGSVQETSFNSIGTTSPTNFNKAVGGINDYLIKEDLMYSLQMLKIIAASDNWAKNTYLYNPGIYEECNQGDIEGNIVRTHGKDSGNCKKGDIIKVGDDVKQYGTARFATAKEISDDGIQKYKLTSKFRFFQDDLDTILSLNNTGQKVKPYYSDENETNATGAPYWNASQNPLFKLAYYAWDNLTSSNASHKEMKMMMNQILTEMGSIANTTSENKVLDCFDKYYGDITRYFPATAYNEISKLLYEHAKFVSGTVKNPDAPTDQQVKWPDYSYSINPLSQSVGDQSIAEYEWFKRRSIYLSSYAEYGIFAAKDQEGSAGSLIFRTYPLPIPASTPYYEIRLKPNMYLWPTWALGSQGKSLNARALPGQEIVINDYSDNDTNLVLRGIHYYSSLGDLGKTMVKTDNDFTVTGKSISEFNVTGSTPHSTYDNAMDYDSFKGKTIFVPKSISFKNVPSLRKIQIIDDTALTEKYTNEQGQTVSRPAKIGGSLALTTVKKIEHVDVTGTNMTSVTLPTSSNIEYLALPESIISLSLVGMPKLTNDKLILKGIDNITSIEIDKCPNFNELSFIKNNFIEKNNTSLSNLIIKGVNWTSGNNDRGALSINDLNYLINIDKGNNELILTGVIEIEGVVDFKLKMDLLSRFGNIDDPNNSLHVIYAKTSGSPDSSAHNIIGPSHIWVPGIYDMNVNYVGYSGDSANDFIGVKWGIRLDNNSDNNIEINETTGRLNIKRIPQNIDNLTVSCTISRYNSEGDLINLVVTKIIYLRQPAAKIGDYVYSDGTYGSPKEGFNNKDIIGVCIYAEPIDSTQSVEEQLKIAAATEVIKCYASNQEELKTRAYLPSWGRTSTTLFTNMSGTNSVPQQEVDTSYVNKQFRDYQIIVNAHANCTQIYPDSTAWGGSYTLPQIVNIKHKPDYDNGGNEGGHNSPLMDFGRGKYSHKTVTNIDQNEAAKWCAGKFNTMYLVNNRSQSIDDNGRPMVSYVDLAAYKNTIYDELKGASSQLEYFNYVIMGSNTYKSFNTSGILVDSVFSTKAQFISNYNPAATYCHIYKPFKFANELNTSSSGNVLHDKFKEGNWFLPSAAELSRILYFAYTKGSAFSNVTGLNVANGYESSFSDLNTILKDANNNSGNNSGGRTLFWSSTSSNYNSADITRHNHAFCLGYLNDNTLRMYAEKYTSVSGSGTNNSYGNKEYIYHLWPCVQF